MFQELAKKRQYEHGFTLMELLVVVAIMGILAAIVMTSLLTFVGEGKDEAQATEMDNLQSAVRAMMVDAGVIALPGAHDEVDTLDEIKDVTVTDSQGTVYTLDHYLTGGKYPLSQAYDIDETGLVSVD